ncbi:DegT/DnrJ/EryC1/StrS family aminotransferase [Pedobacter sp.]
MEHSLKSKIWLSSPHMSGKELSYVEEAFRCNWIAPLGPHVDVFENDLCRYNGVKHAAALSSGTAAIHLGLRMLDVQPNDYVLTQSLTFVASANPIKYLGGMPVFIDSEKETWNMCPKQLEKAIIACMRGEVITPTGKGEARLPKAIIPVHLYGMPANMQEIMRIANEYGIPVLEDAAEALGSTFDKRACGGIGKLGVLSFNGNKIITTSAGGALLSNDDEMIKQAKFLATQAKDVAKHYEHTQMGYNYRLSNILAGIGITQLEIIDDRVAARRSNFNFYSKYFSDIEGIDLLQEPNEKYFSNRWLTTISVNPKLTMGITRDDIMTALASENIESRPIWKPMHLQPLYAAYPYFGSGVSDDIFNTGLCLPSGSNLTQEDLQRITEVFDGLFRKSKHAQVKVAVNF